MSKHLHIVSFDVPLPANYGGVIDVFYKLKALHQLGVKIHLHCFYNDRESKKELETYCENITYYKRKSALKSYFSVLPFVVKTRSDKKLISNLNKDNEPVLFEGLHSTYPLFSGKLSKRVTFVRTHNIEHGYYEGLAKSESSPFKKMFFKQESAKLKPYQSLLSKASHVLSLSPFEYRYFKNLFNHTHYIPVFHQNTEVQKLSPKGDYALYVGDLRISDNQKTVAFLIGVFKDLEYPLIIASSFNNLTVIKKIKPFSNIQFQKISNKTDADKLLADAHINVMLTFQKTGIKLKLINTLFGGRFCIVNNLMVEDTGLASLCLVANTQNEFRKAVEKYISASFEEEEFSKRSLLLKDFNVLENAKKIVELL